MSRKFFDNSDNEEKSFGKEYLNLFNHDYLEEDEGDDDYNVVEDILTHKYNYDDKPYYLSIPKKEVNDLINDANLQDNLDIFSEEENEYRYLSRKTHRNKDNKDKKNINNIDNLNNKQMSNLSNNDQSFFNDKNNSNLNKNIFNNQYSNFSNISAIQKKNNEEEKINIKINKTKPNKNKIAKSPKLPSKDSKEHKVKKSNKYPKNSNINNNNPMESMINNNNMSNNNYINNQNNNFMMKYPNNDFNPLKYDYLSQIKDINQNKGLEQMDIIEKLLFLLKQYDFMLQLLIQNLMMTDNKNLKFRCYTLLFSFYMAKQRVIDNLKFPQFNVSFEFNDIFKSQKEPDFTNMNNTPNYKYQNLRLQLSFFQTPILEILPLLIKFIIKHTFTRDETIKILKDFFPFTNPLYFPISKKFRHSTYIINCNNNLSSQNNNNLNNNNSNNDNESNNQNPKKKKMRKKFNYVDDSLLLLGIYFHGKKNYDIIKQLWLPGRSTEEIKHRIKNLVCQNAPLNIIKKYKTMNESPLNAKDFMKFLKGIQWIGLKNKWNLISRYFLPEKTSEYLENFMEILVEKNVLPKDLYNSNYKNSGNKNRSGNYKKVNIFMDDEFIKMYKENFKDEIEKTKNEINNIKTKNTFFSDVEYEKLDKEYFIKNKDDTKIHTRNKSKKNINNNNNDVNNEKVEDKKNKNNEENKNNGIKGNKDNINNVNNVPLSSEDWEFQMNFLDNELFEKITI